MKTRGWVLGLGLGWLLGATGGEFYGRSLPVQGTHSAIVTSDPPGAFVYVDDALLEWSGGGPAETPVRIHALSASRGASVRVERPGFLPARGTLLPPAGRLHLRLAPSP